jgi:hypothetical protein
MLAVSAAALEVVLTLAQAASAAGAPAETQVVGPAAAAIQATTRPLVALAKPRTAALKGRGAMMRAARAAQTVAAMRARPAEADAAIPAVRGDTASPIWGVRDRFLSPREPHPERNQSLTAPRAPSLAPSQGTGRTMATFGLRQAAQQAGASKSTILRAIQSGRLSASRTDDGGYAIDAAELFRVYPPKSDISADQSAERPEGQDAPLTRSLAAIDLRIRNAALARLWPFFASSERDQLGSTKPTWSIRPSRTAMR